MGEREILRANAIAAIVKRFGDVGRTALMKYLYFLQEARSVPLGYQFSLYTYGPFDSEVLSDLSAACSQEFVESESVLYPNGYGYNLTSGSREVPGNDQFTEDFGEDLDWIEKTFPSSRGASGLELDSTIFYVDREEGEKGERLSHEEISSKVKQIKPKFDEDQIVDRIRFLEDEVGILHASS